MTLSTLLVANRGEIAIRIIRAARELGLRTVAIYPEDDAASLHVRMADDARQLPGSGAAAYLDIEQVIRAAHEAGCDAVHPGYGFLSESAAFARACRDAGLTFVGPSPDILDLFGDKVRARSEAARHGIPVLADSAAPASLDDARTFLASLAGGEAMLIKAVHGGGGRGVRVVRTPDELDEAWERARSEAKAAFGRDEVYVERYLPRARHVEVQIAGDGSGAIAHLWDRDCSIQRRYQKLIEIAPAPGLPDALRQRILDAAVTLASAVRYSSLGTFEFLVDASRDDTFYFIEANTRLQVEHTVTEEVTDVDLVQVQLQLAGDASLADAGLTPGEPPALRGTAIQARVNMETVRADGVTIPSGGTLAIFEPPAGPGIRVDTFGYTGYTTSPRYDSLLAKVIAHHPSPDVDRAAARLGQALAEFRVDGLSTNIPFLRALLAHPAIAGGGLSTRFIDDHAAELVAAAADLAPPPAGSKVDKSLAGARIDTADPLAVLAYGQQASAAANEGTATTPATGPDGTQPVTAPLQGTVVSLSVAEGDTVHTGQMLLVMEAMKMEHEIRAPVSGIVRRVDVEPGDTLFGGAALLHIEPSDVDTSTLGDEEAVDLDHIRDDLREVLDRLATTRDEHRPKAVARRRRTGQRTARENVEDLVDPGSFREYGPLVLAAQRRRRTVEDLIERSPADGMITGVGTVNRDLFPEPASRCAVLAYDYTVFAGTQGQQNHRKTDRLISIAEAERMPLVLFAEGGGGRPGDTDGGSTPGTTGTFGRFPQLSGLVPLVGITSGRCFAGNASLLGCCDVIIATANSNIGMGGPAMIEGGGLGIFAPEEIGPMSVQVANGVVDIAVADEAEAVAVAKQYLSYFQGSLQEWEAPDQREMRQIVPENRLRVYDIRRVISTLADKGSVLELRQGFGFGMVTSLIRVEGHPVGVVANNPAHLGGAIDSDAADKGARFLQICDAFDIPVLFLCDTPGIMVGPEVEKTALVRHANRMFLIGANLDVPFFTIILRKAYGLGAIAMAGGSYRMPRFTVAWPTGEFGGMGLEGMVKLGYRNELAAIDDPEERRQKYEEMVAQAYQSGKALNQASLFGFDDTIDPAESREWVAQALRTTAPRPPREGKKRPAIDGW